MDLLPPQLCYTLIAENYSRVISGHRSNPPVQTIFAYILYILIQGETGDQTELIRALYYDYVLYLLEKFSSGLFNGGGVSWEWYGLSSLSHLN